MANHNDPAPTPNWFYYYNQAWQNPWGIPVTYCTGSYEAYFWAADPLHIHIDDLAHGDTTPSGYGTELFAKPAGEPFVKHVGYEDVRGIDNYVRTVAHECAHKRCWDAIHNGALDADPDASGNPKGDGVPDVVEVQVGLNINNMNTTGFSGGDKEAFARMCERGLFGNASLDWADDGLNKGNPPPPNFAQRTVRTIKAEYLPESSLTFSDARDHMP